MMSFAKPCWDWSRRAHSVVSLANLLRPSTTPLAGTYAMWQRPWKGSSVASQVDANSMSRTCAPIVDCEDRGTCRRASEFAGRWWAGVHVACLVCVRESRGDTEQLEGVPAQCCCHHL